MVNSTRNVPPARELLRTIQTQRLLPRKMLPMASNHHSQAVLCRIRSGFHEQRSRRTQRMPQFSFLEETLCQDLEHTVHVGAIG